MEDFAYDEVIQRILSKNRWGNEAELAKRLGISPNTWTAYKRGQRSFGLNEIAKICDMLEVSPQWLLFGAEQYATGVQSSAAPDFQRPQVDEKLMDELRFVVEKVHKETNIHLSSSAVIRETTALYNDVQKQTEDMSDREEIEAVIRQLQIRLKRRLTEAKINPGSGKRSAS